MSNGICLICNEGFRKSDGKCVACSTPLEYVKNNECMKCKDNCIKCRDESECFECNPGYFLKDNKCKSCLENCLECFSEGICNVCESGFSFDFDKKVCQNSLSLLIKNNSLNLTAPNLSEKSDSGSDKITLNNIFLSDMSGEIVPNCFIYNKTLKCRSCKPGYFGRNGSCLSCLDNCMICFDAKTCKRCFSNSKMVVDSETRMSVCLLRQVGFYFI